MRKWSVSLARMGWLWGNRIVFFMRVSLVGNTTSENLRFPADFMLAKAATMSAGVLVGKWGWYISKS